MRQIILAHAQSLRHHTQRDRLTVVCIQIAPHAVRQHRRHFTLLLLLVDTTAEQGIGQIQHCLCQTAAHGMQVSRIGAEQIQQVHGLAYLPGKLSARDDRTLPFRDQAVGRQTFYIDIGNCYAVRPDLPHLIGFLAVQHTLIADNNVALSNRIIPVIHHVLSLSAAHIEQLQTVVVHMRKYRLLVVVIAVDRNAVEECSAQFTRLVFHVCSLPRIARLRKPSLDFLSSPRKILLFFPQEHDNALTDFVCIIITRKAQMIQKQQFISLLYSIFQHCSSLCAIIIS